MNFKLIEREKVEEEDETNKMQIFVCLCFLSSALSIQVTRAAAHHLKLARTQTTVATLQSKLLRMEL